MKGTTGYCAVTADILHPGHLKFIGNCRNLCEHLVVGVMTDKCVKKYKGHYPVMNYVERAAIVDALKDVHMVIPQDTFEFPIEKLKSTHGVDIIFDTVKHQRKGATMYLPYDESISSSEIKNRILKQKGKK